MYQASAHPYTSSLLLSSFYLRFQDPSYLVVFDVDCVFDIFRGFYCEFCGGEFGKHNLRQKTFTTIFDNVLLLILFCFLEVYFLIYFSILTYLAEIFMNHTRMKYFLRLYILKIIFILFQHK